MLPLRAKPDTPVLSPDGIERTLFEALAEACEIRRPSDEAIEVLASRAHDRAESMILQAMAEGYPGAGPEDADLPEEAGVVPIQMEGDGPVVVREKYHAAKPVSVDQALFEMELVGHDFYLFRDEQCGLPSVVYRRHGYQYGLIRLVEQPQPDAAANGGRPV